jgi:hypothetical protein
VATAAVEPATARFVDPALDEEHFRDRTAGRGLATGRVALGCFTGRAAQLRRLATWMDSHHDPAGPSGRDERGGGDGLMVVTDPAHAHAIQPVQSSWSRAACTWCSPARQILVSCSRVIAATFETGIAAAKLTASASNNSVNPDPERARAR